MDLPPSLVVINVEGGIIQEVFSNVPDVRVVVVDNDGQPDDDNYVEDIGDVYESSPTDPSRLSDDVAEAVAKVLK